MSTIADLLTEIEAFCKEAGIAEATFASRAVRDGKFVGRLRAGKGVTIATIDRVRAYIATERARMASGEEGPPRRRAATFPREAA